MGLSTADDTLLKSPPVTFDEDPITSTMSSPRFGGIGGVGASTLKGVGGGDGLLRARRGRLHALRVVWIEGYQRPHQQALLVLLLHVPEGNHPRADRSGKAPQPAADHFIVEKLTYPPTHPPTQLQG